MKAAVFFVILMFGLTGCSSAEKADAPAPSPKSDVQTSSSKSSATGRVSQPSPTKQVSAPVNSSERKTVTCIYGKVKREIAISQANDKCTVQYIKEGTAQEVATGAANSTFCTEVAERVKNNLATAGYKCE